MALQVNNAKIEGYYTPLVSIKRARNYRKREYRYTDGNFPAYINIFRHVSMIFFEILA